MPSDPTTRSIAYTRLRIVLDGGPQPWAVPIDYYRLLRAAVYRLLHTADPNLAEFLHAGGFSAESPAIDFCSARDLPSGPAPAAEIFKLFCFSSLIGDGALRQGRLVFDRPVLWFFATPLRLLADAVTAALRQAGTLRIGRADLKVADVRQIEEPAAERTLTCTLLSPLVISAPVPASPSEVGPVHAADQTATGSGPAPHTGRRYLTREDGITLTEARLRTNLLAKHRALYGIEPDDPEFTFLWTAASTIWPAPDRPTRLVRLSARSGPPIHVRGSLGAVTLAGSPELLRVAMHAGLGQHNASGMGFLLPEADSPLLQI